MLRIIDALNTTVSGSPMWSIYHFAVLITVKKAPNVNVCIAQNAFILRWFVIYDICAKRFVSNTQIMQCSIPSVDSGTDNQLRLIYLLLFYTITKVCRVKVPWDMFSRMAKPNLYTADCRKYLELWIHWKNQRYLNWEHFYEGIARHLLANSQYCISLEGFKMVLVKCTRTLHAHA